MKYEKPAKTCEEQADLLLSRGLVADRKDLIAVLTQINYYRLSTYLYTFRDSTDLSFYRGVESDIRKNVARSFDQPEEVA